MGEAVLVSIQVGGPREMEWKDEGAEPRSWTSGIYKAAVAGPVMLRRINLDGDGQADLDKHGGVDKAACVYPADHYPFWRGRLGIPEFQYGAFGENFTVQGLDEEGVSVGDVFRVGGALVEVSQPRMPCWKLARRWCAELTPLVKETGFTGWYLRVLEEGVVEAGVPFQRVERRHPEWSVARMTRALDGAATNPEEALALAACERVAEQWRRALRWRAGGRSGG